jgi:transposase
MEAREQRGLIIAARYKLLEKDGQWVVPSESTTGKQYLVVIRLGQRSTCTCVDFEEGNKCKHLFAVELTQNRERQRPPREALLTNDVAFSPKPVYRQNWPAYNAAQTSEKHRFQQLLFDLCRHAEPFSRRCGRGRLPVPAANVLFAVVFKIYSTFSARRFSCDLRDAVEKGYLSKPMHYNAICAYLDKPELTTRLNRLIQLSSLPLSKIEKDFAADATGFSTARYSRWFDESRGTTRSGHDWVKVNIMCGVKTNIITAVRVEQKKANESPQLKALLAITKASFEVLEVSADKAYLSVSNIEAIFECGGTPYIPFKSNSQAYAGGLYEKAFHFYSLHREEFLKHYHKRSNVEATFSMIKRKFGNFVRSRSDTSMVNEVLAKILCHNITCLIHSQHELGIDPVFWKDEPLSGKE